jgi:hypothetical protein
MKLSGGQFCIKSTGYSNSMVMETVKNYLTKQLEFGRDAYLKDLEAMSEEDLLNGVGGAERKGIDFTYEVAYVNRRFTARLQGITPEPWPDGGWITAPAEYLNKETAAVNIKDSMNGLIAAWEAIPAEEMTKVIVLESGETSPIDLVFSCCWHTGYHDAQLNYLQQLKGDLVMHWQD